MQNPNYQNIPETGAWSALGLKAVIFDVDGLLFDTESLYLEAWPHIGEKMGLPITREVAFLTTALAAKESEVIFKEHYGDGFSYDEAKKHMGPWLTDYITQNGMPFKPGAKQLVERLHQQGIPLAVGSSNRKAVVEAYLEAGGILHCFTAVSTVDVAGAAKPAPDIFLCGAKMLGQAPETCLAIDDSPIGILAAYRAGCVPCMVPDLLGPQKETKGQVWRVFDSLLEVEKALF